MRFPKSILVLAAAADIAVTLAAAPALANAPRQVRVSYSDLDLTTRDGQQALHRRVNGAAAKLCIDERPLDRAAACRRDVLDTVTYPVVAAAGEAK